MSGGLYNVLFGLHPTAKMVLEALGATPAPPDFRDAWYDGDLDELVVYARLNWRESETPWREGLWWDLPGFVAFEADAFDPTYGFYRYDLPAARVRDFHVLRENGYGAPVDPAKRWRELLDGIRRQAVDDPAVRRAMLLRQFALQRGHGERFDGRIEDRDARRQLSCAGRRPR
jgi:hypothetical protein